MTATPSLQVPPAGTWEIDQAHSNVSFVARYLMLTRVRGRFTRFAGTIHIGKAPEDSSVQVTIEAASIDTGTEQRDDHLRSPDFLDVERFPELSFQSTKVERTGEATLRVTGDLTIRDMTRSVGLDAEYEGMTTGMRGETRVAFSATTELDREEWGVTWNMALEAGGVLVGRTVQVEIEVQAIRREADPPS